MEIKRARDKYVRRVKNREMEQTERDSLRVDRVNPQRYANLRAAKAEEGIITLLAYFPDRLAWLQQRLSEEDFVTDFNRKVYAFFAQKISEGSAPENLLSAHFEAGEVARIVQILNTQILARDPMPQFEDYIKVLQGERRKKADVGKQSPEQLQKMLEQKKRRQ